MSKHGQEFNEQFTQKEMFEMGRKYETEQMAEHSEVEGLVEEFSNKFSDEDGYIMRYEHDIKDWLRTALTTHGAKEYERGQEEGVRDADAEGAYHSGFLAGREEERKTLEEKIRFAYNAGFQDAKSQAIGILLTPQTEVTKN